MKRYNAIKNLMLASATATLYWGWIVDGVDTFKKVVATICIFVFMLLLLRDADKEFLRNKITKKEGRT